MQTLITIAGINRGNIIHHHHLPFNHIVKLIESALPLLSQVLTIRERRRFESIPIQLEGYSETQTLLPPSGSQTSHLWYDSGVASPNRSTLSENHSAKVVRDSNPWTYANGSPYILTTSRMHTTARVPGLSRATRLRGRNDLSG